MMYEIKEYVPQYPNYPRVLMSSTIAYSVGEAMEIVGDILSKEDPDTFIEIKTVEDSYK